MTKERLNEHKANMDKITENLGGVKEDIWQDPYKLANYLYMIAECLSEILIEMERKLNRQK